MYSYTSSKKTFFHGKPKKNMTKNQQSGFAYNVFIMCLNIGILLFQDAGLLPICQHPIGINLEIVGLLVSFV